MTDRRPLRLFVAAYPPLDIAEALLARPPLAVRADAHAVPAAQVHLTLLFLGDADPRELPELEESVGRSAAGVPAFTLAASRLRTLPERAPRLIAAETDSPAPLLEIHRRLAHRLARSPRTREETRFLPHLTLARFRHDAARPAPIDEPIEPAVLAPVGAIVLVRSILAPAGARHVPVRTYPLTGG